MNDQYSETIHIVANQVLHDILPDNEDVLPDSKDANDIMEVEMLRMKEILKAFSMSHDRGIICLFIEKKTFDRLGSSMIKCYIIRNCLNNVYKC